MTSTGIFGDFPLKEEGSFACGGGREEEEGGEVEEEAGSRRVPFEVSFC